jgi:peptidoglycan-associated lipoprotein
MIYTSVKGFDSNRIFSKENTMKSKHWRTLLLSSVCLLIFLVPSCAKKKVSVDPATMSTEEDIRYGVEENAMQTQRELEEEDLKEDGFGVRETKQEVARTERDLFEIKDIFFEFDSVQLTLAAQALLAEKAEWMKKNPRKQVTIEGHADNRGTNEYNLALGEGRAQSAKGYLIELGIAPSRLKTISYGEERPLDFAQTEEAWAKNRRAHFVIDD